MKKLLKFFEKRQVIALITLSFFLNVLIEIFGRKSLFLGLKHMVFDAHIFFYNTLLILCTLSISFLFKRRYFTALFISIVWLALGISNFVVLVFRTTPLSAIDFTIMKSGIKIMPMYFSKLQIVLLVLVALGVIALIIFTWIKLGKKERKLSIVIPSILALALAYTLITILFLQLDIVSNKFKNLANSYKQYGFVYGFSRTIFDRGVSKPKDYSKDAIDEIINEIIVDDENDNFDESQIHLKEADEELDALIKAQSGKPNVIFLQLESFFDVNYMKGMTFSEDPMPVFRYLKNNYSSGFLTVPTIGAGTANTEFEVITGMSLEFFGAGEYPYTTILKQSTCETINYNLKELGYKTHAIHNHTGTFYDRHIVYSQLGFDTFTSIEYMCNVEYNKIGWAKDKVLIQEIVKALKSSKGKDHVYAISVQGHGKYPDEPIDSEQKIDIAIDYSLISEDQNEHETFQGEDGVPKDSTSEEEVIPKDKVTNEEIVSFAEQIEIPFEYYVNQLSEMDKFIGALISKLESLDEPIVLVMFGDHLPAFDFKDEYLKNNDMFQTEYIIWDNIGLEKIHKDVYSYQLSSEVMNKVDITNGILTKFHEKNIGTENYKYELEMLEHDMLYGEKEVYGGVMPYIPTNLKMGIYNVLISRLSIIENYGYVIGSNFTNWSQVYVNGKKQTTKYVDNNLLIVENIDVKYGDMITVLQIADDGTVLSTSKEFEFK